MLAAGYSVMESNARLLKSSSGMMPSNHELPVAVAAKLGVAA